MKIKTDAVQGWLRKAASDLCAAQLCLAADAALDAACFHAQQSAEKYLKAYLIAMDMRFPFVHNLEQLVDLCAERDPAFAQIKERAQILTPFAVELRYDDDFWPTRQTVADALDIATQIKEFVLARICPNDDTA